MNPQFTKQQYDQFFSTHDVTNAGARAQFEKDFAGQGTANYHNPWEQGFGVDGKPIGVSIPTVSKVNDLASTLQPSTPTSNIVSSSDSAVTNEKNTINTVKQLGAVDPATDSATKASEEYMKTLESQMSELEKRRADEVKQINDQFDATQRSTEDAQMRETGTTNVALQRVGGYLGTQISAVGVLNNMATAHRAEISSLQVKRAAAIQEANNAISDKEFELAKAKAQEVKDLDKTINDRRNKFFDQSMQIISEQRLQDQAAETKRQNQFKNSLDTIERVAPTILEDIQSMSPEEAQKYLAGAAKELQLDPNMLAGEVNKLSGERAKLEQQEVATLAAKYPSANVDPTNDSYATATAKIRGSKEYALDIAKAEADLANTRSLINQRHSDNSIDYSDPLYKLYSDATGEIVSSPTKARAINGYVDSLLSGKEVVSNDFTGPLLDNQVRESDANKMVTDAFTKFKKQEEMPDATVWSWLSSPEAQDMTDEEKGKEIMQNGKNPEDFGIYM